MEVAGKSCRDLAPKHKTGSEISRKKKLILQKMTIAHLSGLKLFYVFKHSGIYTVSCSGPNAEQELLINWHSYKIPLGTFKICLF
jgi:hypothetical protein